MATPSRQRQNHRGFRRRVAVIAEGRGAEGGDPASRRRRRRHTSYQ